MGCQSCHKEEKNLNQEPDSYKAIMATEFKRYMTSLDEASELISLFSLETEEEGLHADHIDRTKAIHTVVKIFSSLFWEDYLINGFGEMLQGYHVNKHHELVNRSPQSRSQLETYTSSLRGLNKNITGAFFMKIFFPSMKLEVLQKRITAITEVIAELLKYTESISVTLEKFTTWIEHGSKIAYLINKQYLEEDEELEPESYYGDIRVRAYAILKTFDFDTSKTVAFIEDVDGLLMVVSLLSELFHKLYVSIPPNEFENIFNALVSKKMQGPKGEKTKFQNVHELNEYVRQRARESVEEPNGFIFNVSELLEEARSIFIDKLATDVTETMAFLSTKDIQKTFIKQFESGKIWQNANLGE